MELYSAVPSITVILFIYHPNYDSTMARNTRTTRRPRRNVRMRKSRTNARLTHMARQLNMQPRKIGCPSDPPTLSARFQFSGVVPILVKTVVNDSIHSFTAGSALSLSSINVKMNAGKTALLPTAVSWRNVLTAINQYYFIAFASTENETEIALDRVRYWGPYPSKGPGVETALSVDCSEPYGRCTVRDTGTQIVRPKCAISVPYRAWISSTNVGSPILVVPDGCSTGYKDLDAGQVVGIVHVSFTLRTSALPTTATFA